MNEIELRELDAQVHRALYPDDDVSHILNFGPRLTYVGDRVFRTNSRRWMRLPHYTTDIGAWEPIYALRPEWMWDTIEFYGHTDTVLFYDVWREDPLPSIEVNVPWDDARGLAAYALGRARCVLQWAEAQHGG